MKSKRLSPNTKLCKTQREDGQRITNGSSKDGVEIIAHKSQSSVLIKKDSKGQVSFEVKAYADDVKEAAILATSQYGKLCDRLGF